MEIVFPSPSEDTATACYIQCAHSMMLQPRVIFVSACLFSVVLRQSCCFALSTTSAAADACRATFSTWFDPERNGRKLELRHVVGVDPLPTNLGDGVATFGANGKVSGEKRQSHNEERLVRYAPLCFPHQLPTKNRSAKALKSGRLQLNDVKRVEGCRIVQKNDVLTLQTEAATKLSDEDLEKRMNFVGHLVSSGLSVHYEDDHLAAVFKPAGVHTKKNTNFSYLSFEDALPAILTPPSGDDAAKEALPLPLAVHRLDVRVCGLVLVAKTRSALQNMGLQFEKRTVKKKYEAIVIGDPSDAVQLNDDIVLQEDGTLLVDSPIEMDGRGTLPARTAISILETIPHSHWGTLGHLELRPETGRTHQLRLHAARIGTPIVGDDLYWDTGTKARSNMAADISETGDLCDLGITEELPSVRRGGGLYLQSRGAIFQHPITGEVIDIEVPLIDRFGRLLEKARLAHEYENK